MRHFKFPSSDAHAPPFFPFVGLPQDIGLAIMERCSPFDIVQLSLTSRSLRSFIHAHHGLWDTARSNLCRGACPCLPGPPGSNISESAYASFLFTREQCTPANSVTRFQAFSLEAWHTLYVEEKAAILRENFETLKRFAVRENKKVQGLLRCPTLASLFHAFNRDLTPITHTVWMQHRKRVLAEFTAMVDGVFPPGITAQRNDKVRCAHCPRLLRLSAMGSHISEKHQGPNANEVPTLQPCPDCDSKRVFTKRGLDDHRLSKHSHS
ncbi:hypothetical protein DFH06DRAFT_625643 [Mycena polygramma]|nr:hypothetical protein DFH06DRAFT_625643 [Mycena polygramma]